MNAKWLENLLVKQRSRCIVFVLQTEPIYIKVYEAQVHGPCLDIVWVAITDLVWVSISDLNYGSRLDLHLQRETHGTLGFAGKEAGYGGWRPWQHSLCSRTRYHIHPAFSTKMNR